MKYELAKQLKEAGFPQKSQFWWHKGKIKWQGGTSKTFEKMVATGYVAAPTLSELIEACGEDLNQIDFLHDQNKMVAYSADSIDFDRQGSTPEEAIAKLWLALHANK